MRIFTAAELARMRVAQNAAMMDVCVIQTFTEATDTYGQLIRTWSDGTPLAFGIDSTGGGETRSTDKTVVRADAVIRLPIDIAIDVKNRIKVIVRHGEAIAPIVYGILEEPQRGPSGLVLRLEKVDPHGESL